MMAYNDARLIMRYREIMLPAAVDQALMAMLSIEELGIYAFSKAFDFGLVKRPQPIFEGEA